MTGKPLDGVVVVAMEHALAVPFATRQLADLGARVIKIERPGSGDFARAYDSTVEGLSSAFVWLNRGKESVELDVKTEEGRRTLDLMLARADVFLHNISPAAAERLGLDSATLSRAFPGLISGSVSGYGTSGPMADFKAYDLLIQAETGLLSLTGDEENYAKVGISIADISAGMYSYASVLAALLHRERNGESVAVDVSLFDSLTEWLAYPLYFTKYGGVPPRRMGTSHATIAPYGVFKTADGGQVLLAVQNDREWVRFCQVVLGDASIAQREHFRTPSLRLQNREALDVLVSERMSRLDRARAVQLLDEASIAFSRLHTIADLEHHEQLVERGRWMDTQTEAGVVQTLRPPWVPDGHEDVYSTVPALGEHTEQVMRWLSAEDD